MRRACGGVLEGRGLIVGGWHDDRSEGSFGVRGWITRGDTVRLGLEHESLVHPRPYDEVHVYPSLPEPLADEQRLTPSGSGSVGGLPTEVAVTCEEYYQDVIAASRPAGWDGGSWPVLVDLALGPNPHAKSDAPAVEVRIGNEVVGYFTAAMTERHCGTVKSVEEHGQRPTASASVRRGTKGGADLWRLHVGLGRPARG